MSKRSVIAGLVLCAGSPVVAQVNNDVNVRTDDAQARIQSARNGPITAMPEGLGDLIAGPYNVEFQRLTGVLGVDHAWDHYWISARAVVGQGHRIGKYTEDGIFVKAFRQSATSAPSSWGYRDGASDEAANQLFYGWEGGNFAIHEYDPATGNISETCAQTICSVDMTVRALTRTPNGTFITKDFYSDIVEFDDAGNIINTWPDPGIEAYGCAYDAANNTYWWTDAGGFVVETDADMNFTGRMFDSYPGFTLFGNQGGMDIYADSRSPTGSAFVILGQGTPDEIAIFEADAGAGAASTSGPHGCNAPPPPPPPPPLGACYLDTIMGSNNNGNVGGIIYMDMSVGPQDLVIDGLEVNTGLMCEGPFQIEMWTRPTTYVGGECSPGEWTLVATGDGLGYGLNTMSQVVFPSPPTFDANQRMGIAFVGIDTDHKYTNGTGGNQLFTNDDMRLTLGAAQNVPWDCATFDDRVWNGRFYYTPASGCAPCPLCACQFDTTTGHNICDIFDFLSFQGGFVGGDPCAIDLDTTTGIGVGDIFDFLAFQANFVTTGSCP